ncbi:MAG: hypothetical protein J0L82_12610 [Deltaproteobacteria bacterium]|nr:hypothetical protein [Deltaproteobacteria bacterium]
MVKPIKLSELFLNLQSEMSASLGIMQLQHGPTKGDYTELNWLELLQTYLPKRYCAEKAFVIDAEGMISEAIDIVVFDNHFSPFLLNKHGVKFVPAESVYAVFEVKQEISPENIRYAAKKAKSVRKLKRSSATINNAGTIVAPKTHSKILAGILTTFSAWNRKKFESHLRLNVGKLRGDSTLEIGCCLRAGSFAVESNSMTFNKENKALVGFFLDLVHALQLVGTVPAIDIATYKSSL